MQKWVAPLSVPSTLLHVTSTVSRPFCFLSGYFLCLTHNIGHLTEYKVGEHHGAARNVSGPIRGLAAVTDQRASHTYEWIMFLCCRTSEQTIQPVEAFAKVVFELELQLNGWVFLLIFCMSFQHKYIFIVENVNLCHNTSFIVKPRGLRIVMFWNNACQGVFDCQASQAFSSFTCAKPERW